MRVRVRLASHAFGGLWCRLTRRTAGWLALNRRGRDANASKIELVGEGHLGKIESGTRFYRGDGFRLQFGIPVV
jgi:hypothetical protein